MLIQLLVSVICAILFRLGGWGAGSAFCPLTPKLKLPTQKWVGRVCNLGRIVGIGLVMSLLHRDLVYLLTFFIATNVFSYGENSWLRKLVGRDWQWVVYGFVFGLASLNIFTILIATPVFYGVMKLSNDGYKGWKLDQSYVELITGAIVRA